MIPDFLKKGSLWLARHALKRKKAGVVLAGYFNGSCPVCEAHIGTNVFKDKLTQAYYCFCGACGREIYEHIDQARILWLKPYEPVQST